MQLATNTRNAGVGAMTALCDAGTINANGQILIGDTGFVTTLATIEMNIPAFLTPPVGGVSSLDLTPDVQDSAADNTGTAAEMRIVDRDGNIVFEGSVGTSGKDLNLNSVNLEAGVPVKITSCNITVPAGSPA